MSGSDDSYSGHNHSDDILQAAVIYKKSKRYPDGLSANTKRIIRKQAEKIELKEDEIFIKKKKQLLKYIICKREQMDIIESCHKESGHPGLKKTIDTIYEKGFTWRGILKAVKRVVSKCPECNRRRQSATSSTSSTGNPWNLVALSLIGPFAESRQGNKFVLVLLDENTKWANATAIPTRGAHHVALALFKLFTIFGLPKELVTMREAEDLRNALNSILIKKLHLPPSYCLVTHRPQADTQGFEAFNKALSQTINEELIKLQDVPRWDEELLSTCVFGYNSSRLPDGHGTSPFENMFKRKPFHEGQKIQAGTSTSAEDSCTIIQDICWIKELNLQESDKLCVTERNGWLNDKIIKASSSILKDATKVAGLQDPILGETQEGFKAVTSDCAFVQILNVNQRHWITVSRASGHNHVDIYDSLLDDKNRDISNKTKQQIAGICGTNTTTIIIKKVQQQVGGSDCGVFAIAFATSLCYGEDPCAINYDQTKMRIHLKQSLEQRTLTVFPRQ